VTMALRDMPDHDDRPEVVALFANLKAALPQLQALLDKYNGDYDQERYCAHEDCGQPRHTRVAQWIGRPPRVTVSARGSGGTSTGCMGMRLAKRPVGSCSDL
jgi:hypothetical protein